MAVAEKTEQDIDTTRLEYVPVAVRTQILFFCVSDLSNVDPMYQYSLEWFLGIFIAGIADSQTAGTKTFHSECNYALCLQDYTQNRACEEKKTFGLDRCQKYVSIS